MPTTLVAGVSGRTGAVVAQLLLDQKQKVRVLVHEAAKGERWKKRGAEVAVGSLDDAHAVAAAIRGADAAYLLVPAPLHTATGFFQRVQKFIDTYARTLDGGHLKQVVLLSSVGAQVKEGTGVVRALHLAEKALVGLKVPCTFLRACSFVENWGGMLQAAKGGQLPTFVPVDFKYPQVGTHDIGAAAASLLVEHPKAHRVVELAGPVDATPNDVAAALGKVLGNEVKAVSQPVAQMATALQQFGFSAEMAGLFQELTEGIVARRVVFEHPETVRRGKEPLETTLRGMVQKS